MAVNIVYESKEKNKTKAELLEELENLKQTVADKEKEIKNLERYKKYEEAADELKALHTAMMNSGFTNDQAFQIIMALIPGSINQPNYTFKF